MPRSRPETKKFAPSTWPAWLAVGCAWLVARLPVSAIFALGALAGRLGRRFATSRAAIAERNLELCFPELSIAEREQLLRQNFVHTAIGMLDSMMPWLNPKRDLRSRIDVHGADHYINARNQNRGVLVLAAHFTTMDVISQPLSDLDSFDVMYRRNKNPAWEWLQFAGRSRYFDGVVDRKDTRAVLKRLRAGRSIWYAADQDYGAKHSVFAPFFGIPAASITATARFARLNNSPVVFMATHRDLARKRWSITFSPALEDFPTGDDLDDAASINTLIEGYVREHPEQYLWIHRRFKTRPEGEPRLY